MMSLFDRYRPRTPTNWSAFIKNFRGGQMRSVRGARSMFSLLEYQNYHDHNQTLAGLMAYAPLWTVTLGGERPQEIVGELVSCNYFDVLRQRPAIGPGFTALNCETRGSSGGQGLHRPLAQSTANEWHSGA
jgi:hypothetical protein